jgi:predicted 3-demethylubiquinone-9 3-methyltransferase (glyoxalase superfamily)
MKGFSVTISIDDPDQAERIFRALSENGTVQMPIQKIFWAARFGMLIDQFGTPWMGELRTSRLIRLLPQKLFGAFAPAFRIPARVHGGISKEF